MKRRISGAYLLKLQISAFLLWKCSQLWIPNQKFIYGAALVIAGSSWYYLGFFGMTTEPQFTELVIEGVSYIIIFAILSVEEQT